MGRRPPTRLPFMGRLHLSSSGLRASRPPTRRPPARRTSTLLSPARPCPCRPNRFPPEARHT
eukprot:4140313-Prymnesium_polylepis.1